MLFDLLNNRIATTKSCGSVRPKLRRKLPTITAGAPHSLSRIICASRPLAKQTTQLPGSPLLALVASLRLRRATRTLRPDIWDTLHRPHRRRITVFLPLKITHMLILSLDKSRQPPSAVSKLSCVVIKSRQFAASKRPLLPSTSKHRRKPTHMRRHIVSTGSARR